MEGILEHNEKRGINHFSQSICVAFTFIRLYTCIKMYTVFF